MSTRSGFRPLVNPINPRSLPSFDDVVQTSGTSAKYMGSYLFKRSILGSF